MIRSSRGIRPSIKPGAIQTAELGLPAEAVTLDRSVISAQLREVYDVVEMEGRIYAFIR
ncbi:hypothetical protein [Microcella flavibacter]|uniref:hypothetical protein n=1 Tax=Microcella flavibacter TaxID=1804990 RepID=UPI0014575E9B|nr:hypothetical protein [Microcella flavibacter]